MELQEFSVSIPDSDFTILLHESLAAIKDGITTVNDRSVESWFVVLELLSNNIWALC